MTKELMTRELRLYEHLANFYPPMRDKAEIISAFRQYWDHSIDIIDLSNQTGIDIDDIYSQFDYFLNFDDAPSFLDAI